jgi:putative intracellular protease/amidase
MAISTAILVFEGVPIIDCTGPYEAFVRVGSVT